MNNRYIKKILLAFLVFITLLFLIPKSHAQSGTWFNQRDDQYRVLGLKRAKDAFEVERSNYERQLDLFDKKLISLNELENAKVEKSNAEVNYLQSILAVLFERQVISVSSAIKYYAQDGSRHLKLILINASEGGAEFHKLLGLDETLYRSLQPDVISNVYVSIQNDDGSIISNPYETKIGKITYGKPVNLDFKLLQDLDAVTVSMIYGNGYQRNMEIYLQKDLTSYQISINSNQFSQECDLSSKATFDLNFELFGGSSDIYHIKVLNLPKEITYSLVDPSSNARINQIKFTDTERSKKVYLELRLPEEPSNTIKINSPIQFYAVAIPSNDKFDQNLSIKQVEKLNYGFTKLELIPKGFGKLLFRSNQLYTKVKKSDTAIFNFKFINEGSYQLDNIRFDCDAPFGWREEFSPEIVKELMINVESSVILRLYPPDNVIPGRYDVRLMISGSSLGRSITIQEKILTIEVDESSNYLMIIIISFFILLFVLGSIYYAKKLVNK